MHSKQVNIVQSLRFSVSLLEALIETSDTVSGTDTAFNNFYRAVVNLSKTRQVTPVHKAFLAALSVALIVHLHDGEGEAAAAAEKVAPAITPLITLDAFENRYGSQPWEAGFLWRPESPVASLRVSTSTHAVVNACIFLWLKVLTTRV